MKRAPAVAAVCCLTAFATSASAQSSFSAAPPKPRPTGRIAIFADAWTNDPDDAPSRGYRELITSAAFHAAETEEDGLDYGLDVRHSGFNGGVRPERVSLYEAFAGVRLGDGRVRLRGGHLWLNDLGALGSVAGGHFELRQAPNAKSAIGRLRIGVFGGLEPKVFETGYYPGVKKFGAYTSLDGEAGRRHTVGYINLRDASLTERSVVSTTNFVPVKRVFFLYQAAEYDLVQPAGQAKAGLNYFFSNARANVSSRVELQGTYNRGRSVDTRGLADDVINGRPISQSTALGLVYESIGGRLTVEPIKRIRVYAGYSQDKSNREDKPADRTLIGGYAPNLGGSGLDLSASDSRIQRTSGTYHSDFVSLGRQVSKQIYVSGDYTTSLSIVRFSRSDGILIEERPTTKRVSGTASINVGPTTTLQITVDRTWDTGVRELRLLSGIAYRFR